MSLNPNGAPPGYYYQAGATAYLIDPAGTYSCRRRERADDRSGRHIQRRRGQRADTSSSGHVYSGRRGDLLRGGDCRSCRHLQRRRRERGNHRPGRQVQRRRGEPPKLAAAGTYIPVTGATSSAAEIVDSGRHLQRRRGQRAEAGGGRHVYSCAPGRPPPRRRLSIRPARTAPPARARRRPILPARTASPGPARRR